MGKKAVAGRGSIFKILKGGGPKVRSDWATLT
jgi:hypothetical protein